MKDFISAALPWIIIGLCLAIFFANMGKVKKAEQSDSENHIKDSEAENRLSEGMCIGMCAGVVLGSIGVMNMGLGISLGMAIGLAIGLGIKKQ